jgi:hypothetical protein
MAKIQGRAAQEGNAFVVDKKLHSIVLNYCIAVFRYIQHHVVMQTGAAASGNVQPKAFLRIF